MIEDKLIAIHQWIIDETQKKPGWWAEQVIMAATLFEIVRKLLTWKSGWDAVMLLICLVTSTFLVMSARNEAELKIFNLKWARGLFLSILVFQIYMLFTTSQVAINILDVLSATFMLSFYCFAACDAPRPKKRKEKLVLRMA